MGACEQARSRYLWWLNSSKNFGWDKRLSHFIGAIGFFLRKPIVKFGIFSYLVFMLLLGVGGYQAFPIEIIFGIIGILYFTQAITFTGHAQIMLEKGISVIKNHPAINVNSLFVL